jgi:hypothetical protein
MHYWMFNGYSACGVPNAGSATDFAEVTCPACRLALIPELAYSDCPFEAQGYPRVTPRTPLPTSPKPSPPAAGS